MARRSGRRAASEGYSNWMTAISRAASSAAAPSTSSSRQHPVTPSATAMPLADISVPPIGSISVLIPVMNEEGNLDELHARLTAELERIGLPWEIVFVDDGSHDATWDIVSRLSNADDHVIGLRHRRNFGKARALANGFRVVQGDVVITMDGDLQDDPAELTHFLATLDEGYDLVSGWKQRRQDPLGKTAPSKLFNWTVRKTTGVPLHDFNCGFKAYRRDVTATIRLYGELHRFTPVLANAEGFRVTEIPVVHHARKWGSSKYGWSRLTKGFLDLLTVIFLTQYRQQPMHLFGLPGLLSMFLGVLAGLWLLVEKFVFGEPIGTRPLLMLSVLLVVIGAQFFALGLLGEFLAHGSQEQKRDPLPFRETVGLTDRPDIATVATRA
jgi:glycosyltransferase involved in cell wall biosynthesis